MVIFNENYFTQAERKKWGGKYRLFVADGKRVPVLRPGESIQFILDSKKLYSIDIRMIENILYAKNSGHQVHIKLDNECWNNVTKEHWKTTYKEGRLWHSIKHKVLVLYELKMQDYFEQVNKQKLKEQTQARLQQLLDLLPNVPTESELQIYIDTWARAYEVYPESDTYTDLLRTYVQLKYYVDHNLDVSNRETEPDIVYVGDENLFEDLVYKGGIESILAQE